MKKLQVAAFCLALIACGSVKIPDPTSEQLTKINTSFPTATLADLQAGKNIYSEQCGRCHPHKKINKFTAAEWANIVPKMVVKTNKKFGQQIDAAGEQQLLQFVTAFAR
jgi:cytochrome c5